MNQLDTKYCPACGTWTPHALSKDGKHYVCACGEAQTVITTQITASRRFVYTHAGGMNPIYINTFEIA